MKKVKALGWVTFIAVFIKLIIGFIFLDQGQVTSVFDFVETFDFGRSPWDVYFSQNALDAFPYPALMLYVYKIVQLPMTWFAEVPRLIQNALYMVPILLADLGCFWVINKMFPSKGMKVIFFYFISPVVIYASYFLGHLDIIALFFLLLSLYLLQNRQYLKMAIALAMGFSIKIPILFALPLILVYLYRNLQRTRFKVITQFLLVFSGTVLVISLPFIFDKSYLLMVYLNPQQTLLYDLAIALGPYKIYVAYLAILVIYARFLMYEKVNKDLFHNFLAVIYSVFVILVPPSENWYLWSYVLCALLFISLLDKHKIAYALSALFSVFYLVTFLGFKEGHLQNILFTTFEAILMCIVYALYKYGIKSNSVYKKKVHATLIGIGGDSGVGKSTVKQSLVDLLGLDQIVPIESDGDHKWGRGDQSWASITHLNPKANYLYKQAQYLKALKNGTSIERVEYDHQTGTHTAPKRVYANDFVLIAGLHPFYLPQTRRLIDIKIYLDTEEKLRRHWKIKRDTLERGYDLEKIMDQILSREEDASKYIHPQMHHADLVVRYYSEDIYEESDVTADPKIKLNLMLNLDLEVESLVEAIINEGTDIVHHYDSDMRFQHIQMDAGLTSIQYQCIAEQYIENIDEIVNGHAIHWQDGFQGMIQLITLALISHHMKRGDDHEL